jgi:GTP-binding protein EngB required for normal cell division
MTDTNPDEQSTPRGQAIASRPIAEAANIENSLADADESLRAYTHAKQEVAKAIRSALDLLRSRGDEQRIARCQGLLVKLAEDRFNLVVLGQFKRGKSSLMNAVIGRDLLPTGLLPLTSVVTALRFGPAERLVLTRDNSWPQEAPISALAEYVTERGNPGNVKKIGTAYVELPVSLLRRGLHFVDTPGVGSIHEQNTATTYAFLPQCDAALFVTSVDTPLSELEVDFLNTIRQHARKVFFVVNKTDLLAAEEREEVLSFIREGLRKAAGGEEVRLFAVSSREALEAKRAGDEARYRRSGLKELEDALGTFLANEKSRALLVSLLDRALRLLEEESAEVALQRSAALATAETRQERRAEVSRRLEVLSNEIGAIVRAARARLTGWLESTLEPEALSLLDTAGAEATAQHEALLSGFRWASAGSLLRRVVERSQAHVDACLKEWLRAQQPRLRDEVHAALADSSRRLETVLHSALQEIAESHVTASAPDDTDASQIMPSALSLQTAGSNSPQQRPVVPAWLSFMPPVFVRSVVRRAFEAALAEQTRALHAAAMEVLEHAIDDVLKDLDKHCQSRFDHLRARLDRLTTGKPASVQKPGSGGSRPVPPDKLEETQVGIERISSEMVRLRDALLHREPQAVTQEAKRKQESKRPPEAAVAAPAKAAALRAQQSDLAKDLRTRGCPICDRIAEAAFDFFAKWQYALGHDRDAQRAYASTRGFCALHTWQFASIASAQGIGLGYPPLLQQMAAELEALAKSLPEQATGKIATLLPRPSECLACGVLRDVEASQIARLLSYLETQEGRERYSRSQALCMPHLHLLLAAGPSSETVTLLLSEQARHFSETAEDMQGYTLKFDAVRRGLHNKDEEDAHLRALIHLVGERSVVAPWREDAD